MEEIPEDVMKAAREALSHIVYAQDAGWPDVSARVIARAIMAERERCAQRSGLISTSGTPDHPTRSGKGGMNGRQGNSAGGNLRRRQE